MSVVVSQEAMERAKSMFPAKPPETMPSNGPRLNVGAYLEHYQKPYGVKTTGTGTVYVFSGGCLFDQGHKGAGILQAPDGSCSYKCFHNSCQGHTWKEARQIISGTDRLIPFMVRDANDRKSDSKPLEDLTDPMQYLKTGQQLQEMDVHVDWIMEDLLPEKSITTIIGPAGFGKSLLSLNIGDCVSSGEPWLDHVTKQTPAYVLDYENPLAVDVERTRELNITGVYFWHTSAIVPPPRIDSPDYGMLKRLPPGLIIVDGHRASQRGDENSSKDTGLVMERWKELRDLGFTIVIIHHTTKANEQMFRGSQALIDQADHVLYFYPVRKPGSDDPTELEDPDSATYFFGVKGKSRFKSYRIYLKRAGRGRFILAGDPDDEKLNLMKGLLSDHNSLTQTDFLKKIKDELGYGKTVALKLLKKGEDKGTWTVTKGDKNSWLYQLSCSPSIRERRKQENRGSGSFPVEQKQDNGKGTKSVDTPKFTCLPDHEKKTGKQDDILFSDDPPDVEIIA